MKIFFFWFCSQIDITYPTFFFPSLRGNIQIQKDLLMASSLFFHLHPFRDQMLMMSLMINITQFKLNIKFSFQYLTATTRNLYWILNPSIHFISLWFNTLHGIFHARKAYSISLPLLFPTWYIKFDRRKLRRKFSDIIIAIENPLLWMNNKRSEWKNDFSSPALLQNVFISMNIISRVECLLNMFLKPQR